VATSGLCRRSTGAPWIPGQQAPLVGAYQTRHTYDPKKNVRPPKKIDSLPPKGRICGGRAGCCFAAARGCVVRQSLGRVCCFGARGGLLAAASSTATRRLPQKPANSPPAGKFRNLFLGLKNSLSGSHDVDVYPPAVSWAVWSGRCWLRARSAATAALRC
jgi:hypothetical protein